MTEQELMQKFEAAHNRADPPMAGWMQGAIYGLGADGKYFNTQTRGQFEAFKLGVESVAVELPAPFWPKYVDDDEPGLCIATDLFDINQVRIAIEAAGGTVKV